MLPDFVARYLGSDFGEDLRIHNGRIDLVHHLVTVHICTRILFVSENAIVTPLAFCAIPDHALKVGAHIVGARHGSVVVGIQDQDIVRLCVILAHTKRVFNGLLGLSIARISCVNDCWQCCIAYVEHLCVCRYPSFPNRQARSSKIELRAIFVPIHLHLSSTNAFPKTPADHIPFASVLKTNIHDIIFGFLPVRLHSVGVIP